MVENSKAIRANPVRNLPVPTRPAPAREHRAGPARRHAPPAAFISHLVAARHNLDIQRARRRAPLSAAIDAYRDSARRAQHRIPAGYRRALSA